jgi:hypothetical protein
MKPDTFEVDGINSSLWVGKKVTCDFCKEEFVLCEEDAPMLRKQCLPHGKIHKMDCLECGAINGVSVHKSSL